MKVRSGATPNQFIIDEAPDVAGPALQRALNAVGKVTEYGSPTGVIKGWCKYGLNKVKLVINYAGDNESTTVTVTARNGSVWSGPNRSAIDRLKDAMVNDSNPGFASDRVGMSTSGIFGSLALFVVLLVIILSYFRL